MASSIQATRLRKGMLIKVGNDLFRLLELHHLTPGNKRAHIQVRMRNIRSLALADHKFRAEEDVDRRPMPRYRGTILDGDVVAHAGPLQQHVLRRTIITVHLS